MSYEHDSEPLIVEALKDVHDLNRSTAVEIAGRFIGEQDCRFVHQSARDCDALLLSARKLGREVMHAITKSHHLQRIHRPLLALLSRDPRIKGRQLDILQRGCARQEVESLEHESDLPVSD